MVTISNMTNWTSKMKLINQTTGTKLSTQINCWRVTIRMANLMMRPKLKTYKGRKLMDRKLQEPSSKSKQTKAQPMGMNSSNRQLKRSSRSSNSMWSTQMMISMQMSNTTSTRRILTRLYNKMNNTKMKTRQSSRINKTKPRINTLMNSKQMNNIKLMSYSNSMKLVKSLKTRPHWMQQSRPFLRKQQKWINKLQISHEIPSMPMRLINK